MRAPPIIFARTVGVATGSEETLEDFTLEIDVDVANQQSMMDRTPSEFVDGGVEELPRFVYHQLFLSARDTKGRRCDRRQDLFQGSGVFCTTDFPEVLGREGVDTDGVDRWSA